MVAMHSTEITLATMYKEVAQMLFQQHVSKAIFVICTVLVFMAPIVCDILSAQGTEDYVDLSISSEDIYTSLRTVEWIEHRLLSVRVHNNGTQVAENIAISVYLGDPLKGGTLITDSLRLRKVEPGTPSSNSFIWNVEPGTYEIFVVVDPDNIFEEPDEMNNIASKVIVVAKATGQMVSPGPPPEGEDFLDLAISSEDISTRVYMSHWKRYRVLSATIHNNGTRKQILAHELVHIFDHVLSNGGMHKAPFGFINEGLAAYVEEFYEKEIGNPEPWGLRAYWAYDHGLVDLEKLRDWSPFYSDFGNIGYSIGYTFWTCLLEHWGTEGLVDLIQAKETAEDYADLFQEAGIDYETFMRHWMDRLQAGWEANQARLSKVPEITTEAVVEPVGEGYARVYVEIRVSHVSAGGYRIYLSRYVGEKFTKDHHTVSAPEYSVSVPIAEGVPVGTNIRYDAMMESAYLATWIHSGWRELTITEDMFVTAVEDELLSGLPTSVMLSKNVPNPFNAGTVVTYALPRPGWAHLSIYNALGQRIRILMDAKQEAVRLGKEVFVLCTPGFEPPLPEGHLWHRPTVLPRLCRRLGLACTSISLDSTSLYQIFPVSR